MTNIKKFESFNHRRPKMINDKEYEDKLEFYEPEPFSESEISFFRKLRDDNTQSIYDLDFLGKTGTSFEIFLQLYPTGDGDELIDIYITKLQDNWYLIYEPGIEKWICDEWDEVLGYLGTQTTLRF